MSDWSRLTLRITPMSALQLGTESGIGAYEMTNVTIPGAVLRGAAAEVLLKHCTQPIYRSHHADCPDRETCPFWQVFGVNEPLWSFAYPAINGPAYPFPLTARTCKLYPGYEQSRSTAHGVYDTLIGQFIYDLLTDPCFPQRDRLLPDMGRDLPQVGLLSTICPQCSASLQPAVGVYSAHGEKPSFAGNLSVRRATHVGINRARGVAEEGLLFTQESIEPRTGSVTFHGQATLLQETVNVLRPYLHEQVYWIGQGRSRGNGQVKFTLEETQVSSLEDRLDGFQRAVRSVFYRVGGADARIKSLPGALFSLTLHSPLILEQWGQPIIVPPAPPGIPDAVLLRAWARPEVVGGWDAASRMPRRTRLAAQAGSVYLYWTPRAANDADLLAQLRAIELFGMGEERPRGYGQVAVCAPFHLHNRIE